MAQWDRSVEEILPVGQKHVNISSSMTRAQIRKDLAKTRKSARAHWHVERLMTPLDRQMEQYVANIARVKGEFVQLRADIKASREAQREALRLFHQSVLLQASEASDNLQRIKERNDTLRSLAKSLQHIEHDFSDDSLKPLVAGLESAGLWKQPVENIPHQIVSPRGVTSKMPNIRRALAGILYAREQLADNAHSISVALHLLRRTRRTRALCLLTDVSQFRLQDDRLYQTMYLVGTTMASMWVTFQNLRKWLQTTSNNRWRVPFFLDDRCYMLFTKMLRKNSAMKDEYHDHLSNITAVGIKSNFALQQAQLLEFRPFGVWLTRFHDMYTSVRELSDSRQQKDADRRNLDEWMKNSRDLRRESWDAIDVAISWRGAANMCFGIVNGARQQSPLMMTATTTSSHGLPRPALDISPEMQTRLPWEMSEDLYPEEGGIPVHFVTTAGYASMVLQRFSVCKVVGLDLVVKPNSKMLPGSWTAPFEYLVLASGREVAIFYLGVMGKPALLSDALHSILGDPAILKVGVNMEHQRELLEEYCGVDMVEYHDLTPKTSDSSDDHDSNCPGPATISSVVARKFGKLLPEIDLSLASRNLGSQEHPLFSNPPQFFTALASRGYAALQLYHSACLAVGVTDLPEVVAPGGSHPAFGPVCSHSLGECLPYKKVQRAKIRSLQRALYLQSISLAMVKHVFREHKEDLPRSRTVLRNIQAYYLFTSFREHLRTIRSCLQIPNPAAVIYTLTEQYRLPVSAEDREALVAARGFVSNSANGLQAPASESGMQRVKARIRRAKSSMAAKTGVQASSSRLRAHKDKARARPAKSTKVVAKRDIAVRRVTHTYIRKVDPHLIKRFDPYAGANGPDRNGTSEGRSRPPKMLTPSKKSLASENASVGHRAVLSKRHAMVRKVATTATATTKTKTDPKGEKKTQHEGSAVAVKPTTEEVKSASSKPVAGVHADGERGPEGSRSTVEAHQAHRGIRAEIKRLRQRRIRLARREEAAATVDQAALSGASSEVR